MLGRVLKACTDELTEVFTTIYNVSLTTSWAPAFFKAAIIVPVLKKGYATWLNDYRPVALASIPAKCLERLVIKQKMQYPHHLTRINLLSGTIDQQRTLLCFLTNHSQSVRVGRHISATIFINTRAPQGCVLSPLLYNLFTHDCSASFSSHLILKFADDTTVLGLINNNDETEYRN